MSSTFERFSLEEAREFGFALLAGSLWVDAEGS